MLRNFLALAVICSNLGCAAAAQTPPPKEPSGSRILVLEMSVEGPVHRVIGARVVDSSVPLKTTRQAGPTDLNYELTDASDQPLFSGSIDDPRVLRGVFPPASEPQTGHPVVRLESIEYVLRVPYSNRARYLKLRSAPPTEKSSAAEKTGTQVQVLDLGPLLNLSN